jgi:hypothetical protein
MKIKPLDWEEALIDYYTSGDRILTRADISKWAKFKKNKRTRVYSFGNDISRLEKKSRNKIRYDLMRFLLEAHRSKAAGAPPFKSPTAVG